MSVRKIARCKRALERFSLLSFENWIKTHQIPYEDNASLGSILVKGLYSGYIQRKGIERDRLVLITR